MSLFNGDICVRSSSVATVRVSMFVCFQQQGYCSLPSAPAAAAAAVADC